MVDFLIIRRLAKEIHGNNASRDQIQPGPFFFHPADGLLQGVGVDIEGQGVNVHENRGGAHELYHLRRGDKGKGWHIDRMARPHPIGH